MIGIKRSIVFATVIVLAILLLPLASFARLTVKTIPQEDQMREKGIMILCPFVNVFGEGQEDFCDDFLGFEESTVYDPHTEHKLHVANSFGVNVDPDRIICTVIEKDVCHVPFEKTGGRQFDQEVEATELVNISNRFICKYRSDETPGLGVLEIYFTGPRSPLFIGDHILKIEVEADGERGSEIQDICILGFPFALGEDRAMTAELNTDHITGFWFDVFWPGGLFKTKFADALFPFASCKNAALFQREIFATRGYGRLPFEPFPSVAVNFCSEDQQKIPPIVVAP